MVIKFALALNRNMIDITESKITLRKLLSGATSRIAIFRAMGGWCVCVCVTVWAICVTGARSWVKPRMQSHPERRKFIGLYFEQWILLHIQDKPFCLCSSPSHFLAHYVKQFRKKFIARRGPNLMHFLGYVERNYSENIFIVQIPTDNSCDARSKQHLIIA